MELVTYTDADIWLLEVMETNPDVMAELAGAWPIEEIPHIHRRCLEHTAKWSVVLPDRARP